MKVIVCGGRNYNDWEYLSAWLDNFHSERPISVVIEGGQTGADALARRWAEERNVGVFTVKAEWNKYENNAGPIRNRKMIRQNPDAVIAFSGNNGTASMIFIANEAGVRVFNGAASW